MPSYTLYEMNHAALSPVRAAADMARLYFKNPLNPMTHTVYGRSVAAACEVFERVTRRYGKPKFGIESVQVSGQRVPVREDVVWERPFCRMLHFEKRANLAHRQPKLLVVAPLSGHYATLLRGTVETMLPRHDVYVTDWVDARMVPLADGTFDLDDYIDYIVSMLHALGPDCHILAVCQPAVPVFAAVALMEEAGDHYAPTTMTLMGGPIDTRENPTAVNALAEENGTDWFRRNVITKVPFPHPGVMRDVYPGFLQLTGFMSMNLDRHVQAYQDLFRHLVDGDGNSAEKHRDFYDEYLAVMDLTAEFYLQTIDTVFVRQALPRGEMTHRGRPVRPEAIRETALMTVEGERDDISGVGQTKAAHRLARNLADDKRAHWLQPRVGHYGVFNGSRFEAEIAPRIADFIASHEQAARRGRAAPEKPTPTASAAAEAQAARRKPLEAGEAGAESVTLASVALAAPRGAADDLTRIRGIGPKLEKTLNALGLYHYWQVAQLEGADLAMVEAEVTPKGRVSREDWIGQARDLAAAASAR